MTKRPTWATGAGCAVGQPEHQPAGLQRSAHLGCERAGARLREGVARILAAAERALRCIAGRMNKDGTRDLQWWHAPAWAPAAPRFIATWFGAGIAFGLVFGLVFGLAFVLWLELSGGLSGWLGGVITVGS